MILYILILTILALGYMSFMRVYRNSKKLQRINNGENVLGMLSNQEKIKKLVKINRYVLNGWYILLPIASMAFFFFLLQSFVIVKLNTSFNQRLNAILPYIDDHTEKIIKSEWALMKSVEDFQKIDNQINTLGTKAKIDLPKNLIE